MRVADPGFPEPGGFFQDSQTGREPGIFVPESGIRLLTSFEHRSLKFLTAKNFWNLKKFDQLGRLQNSTSSQQSFFVFTNTKFVFSCSKNNSFQGGRKLPVRTGESFGIFRVPDSWYRILTPAHPVSNFQKLGIN